MGFFCKDIVGGKKRQEAEGRRQEEGKKKKENYTPLLPLLPWNSGEIRSNADYREQKWCHKSGLSDDVI